jgi:hypothetical protein
MTARVAPSVLRSGPADAAITVLTAIQRLNRFAQISPIYYG